jgi:hypothetical protein
VTSNGLFSYTPTRDAANLLIAAGSGQGSPSGDWIAVAAAVAIALTVATGAFWLAARARS